MYMYLEKEREAGEIGGVGKAVAMWGGGEDGESRGV